MQQVVSPFNKTIVVTSNAKTPTKYLNIVGEVIAETRCGREQQIARYNKNMMKASLDGCLFFCQFFNDRCQKGTNNIFLLILQHAKNFKQRAAHARLSYPETNPVCR